MWLIFKFREKVIFIGSVKIFCLLGRVLFVILDLDMNREIDIVINIFKSIVYCMGIFFF